MATQNVRFEMEREKIQRQRKTSRSSRPVKHAPKTVDKYKQYAEDQTHETIFVSLPSYRDIECPKTLADIFEKAKYPGRVFVGVCQQNDPDDPDCLESSTARRFMDNIRVVRLDSSEARGPIYARALIEQNLFQDEDYYLTIDSHTLFSQNWDIECIRQLLMCPSDKPILTCYPHEYDLKTRELPRRVLPGRFFKFRGFHDRLGFAEIDPVNFRKVPPKPQPSLFWGAGFSFTTGEVPKIVQFDPNLEYMFLGEEISMAARLWTHGYDFFCPMNAIVFHYTPRNYRPTFWEQFYRKNGYCRATEAIRQQRKAIESASNSRVTKLLMGNLEPGDSYGLGSTRSLEQYQTFCGLNFSTLTYSRQAKMGLTPNANAEELRVKWGL